uniref:Acylglycerol kinase, mitochondrial n=1 Tax=Dicentrarchus labrax TaxID=13489 RepID=A0A8C4H6W6_DICLA
MARVVRGFRTLRNHWKKSTFAVCVLSYGGYWLYGKHCDNVLRREACLVAREFGRQQIGPQERLRKATVILNPAACSGKANNLFEKNAAPILHLAGVEITIVKTDYEGQAKKLMELMEQTDVLIVAGGDGTLQEVVTGLLRRPDQDAISNTPIGFIPLGSQNTLSPSLHLLSDNKILSSHNPNIDYITSATLSILKGETVPLDVLQIKGEKEQPVFALMGLRWGAFRDVAATISKYWYLGPLKTKAAHWFSTLQEWPLVRDVSVSYLAPTLRPPDLPPQKPPRPSLLYRIARRLKNYWSPPVEEPPKVEEPEEWKEQQLSTLELFIQTHNKNPVERRINDSLMICAEPDNFTVGEFITVGDKKEEDPTVFTKASTKLEASACRLQLPEGAAGFYNIDNEEYEAMPVEVRLLPRKLRFYISAERREQLLSQMQ